MARTRTIGLVTAAVLILVAGLAHPPELAAIACPTGGVTIDVCVKNPTSSAKMMDISGEIVGATCVGSGAVGNYAQDVNVTAINGATQCFPVGNLKAGLWVHHVAKSPGFPNGTQHRRVPVLYTSDPTKRSKVSWTYQHNAIWVNVAGDAPANAANCPINAVSDPATCRLRDAVAKASQVSGSTTPTLIRFFVAPGAMTQTTTISLGGQGSITIDAIEYDGRPWIVGDPSATQDPFTCIADLKNKTTFRFDSDNNTIQGLLIQNTIDPPDTQQTKDLITAATGKKNNLVYAVKIDGGNRRNCPGNDCSGSSDLFSVLGGSSFAQPAVTISNVEGHSAIDKGVKSNNGWAVVKDSWFHHNYRGNIQATLGGKVQALRNMADRGGRRLPDDLVVDNGANGLAANGGGATQLVTDGNVSRLNRNNGMTVRESGGPVLNAANDYTCGNRFVGLGASGTSATATGKGVAAAYNADNGIAITTTGTAVSANFGDPSGSTNPGSNAFTQNDTSSPSCQFRNDNPAVSVNAQRNQWTNNAPSTCGSGTVNAGTVRDYFTEPIQLDSTTPAIPSNALIGGQTIRFRGTGFDAIRGNPAPSGGCIRGEATPSQSCCLSQPPVANVCGTGVHNPLSAKGNCVELCDSTGNWNNVPVTAVTPTNIVTQLPGDIACNGDDAIVHVSKRGSGGQLIVGQTPYCTNQAPKDQF